MDALVEARAEVTIIGGVIFLSVAYATLFNNALHWYTQFQTYSLFARVGEAEFRRFDGEYERRHLDRAARKDLGRLVRLNALRLAASTDSSAGVLVN
jgi:hypothetical protein